MLAVRLNDKKEIYFFSTMHEANVVDTGKRDRHGNYNLSMTITSIWAVLTAMMNCLAPTAVCERA